MRRRSDNESMIGFAMDPKKPASSLQVVFPSQNRASRTDGPRARRHAGSLVRIIRPPQPTPRPGSAAAGREERGWSRGGWSELTPPQRLASKRHERNEPLTYSLRSLGCRSSVLCRSPLARPLARPRTRRAVLTRALPARSRAASLGGALPGRVVRLAD